MPIGIRANPEKKTMGRIRNRTIPIYGLSAWPRICWGATNKKEIPAEVTRTAPARLTQWRVMRYHPGVVGVAFISIAQAPRSRSAQNGHGPGGADFAKEDAGMEDDDTEFLIRGSALKAAFHFKP